MKKLFVIALLAISCPTQADTYSHQVGRQQACENNANIAKIVYERRVAGDDKQKWLDKAASQLQQNDRASEILKFAIDYGYDNAADAKDAFMTAWAKCMDMSR